MKKLSVSVMMHPSRRKYEKYLKSKLGENTPIAIDTMNSIWDTCKKAWLMFDPDAEYHVVVQDDAIVGDDFLERAKEYLTDDAVYSFYLGKPRLRHYVDEAVKEGRTTVQLTEIHHEIALCLPTRRILDMIAHCDALDATDDKLIQDYALSEGLEVVYTVPSLIDHRDEKSLHDMNKRIGPAKALLFIGE